MNGAHDLGGMMGFGPVVAEENEPYFHAEWERRAFAIALAMGATGEWSLDESRSRRESLPPQQYLSLSYYEIWLAALQQILTDHGLVQPDEIEAGRSLYESRPVKRVLKGEDVTAALKRGGPVNRDPEAPARFAVGDFVSAKNMNPTGHTRIPRYVHGRPGVIEAVQGCHVFPDSNAAGKGEAPKWLYSVAFKGTDIWGADSDPCLTVRVDLWEPYLEPR
ncbi:nitrile hydratase subunit beta [Rhizobiales bacterium]|uniref:nitrile hydratase subunit beta n=1 Tax=Hongsoonwoonella zoysiae TaxID=2821844 RepID=UPI0015612B6A|nr:nitrile hydratase subunit beta [Hongsoonwoonella zoysiae]NRG17277.1 nitrile hydratase subunit beta [Hongsoonwoonella zoysiae]